MRKTFALFAFAASLLIGALVLGIRSEKPVDYTPKPVPEKPIVDATPNPFLKIGDKVTLQAALSNGFLRAGSTNRPVLLLDIDAMKTGDVVRPDLAIALVLDRSGSMTGDKGRKAQQAAKELVARLRGNDRISIISYASDYSIDLRMTRVQGNRGRIQRVIDDVLFGGGTNLAAGLELGIKEFRGVDAGAFARRIILLSDGNANQGITDANTIASFADKARKQQITVSALGVGVDFNEDLMAMIATSGGGGYYYARRGGDIAKALTKEFASLSQLVARNVEVGLELGQFSISQVFGYRTALKNGRLVIPVGDLAQGEHRQIVVELESTTQFAEGSVPVSDLVLGYTLASSKQHREHRGKLVAVATTDVRKLDVGENQKVIEVETEVRAAQIRDEAVRTYAKGDKAGALRKLKKGVKKLRAKNKKMKSVAVEQQAKEMDFAFDDLSKASSGSAEGKHIIKREKARARDVFVY